MKIQSFIVIGIGWLLLACGCSSSVDSRIARNRAEFNTWPQAVQEKVAAGKIDPGFTPEQVLMALGEPDRKFTRTTSAGTTAVWSYRERAPRVSFGLGLGMGGFSGSRVYAGGVTLGEGYRSDEQLGVVFDREGKVAVIEQRTR